MNCVVASDVHYYFSDQARESRSYLRIKLDQILGFILRKYV